ncbi:MAG: hypothetical protein AAGG99_03565, partial [Pseudomonadota bacterium]
EKFEVFSHVVFNFNGNQYVAVPLDAPSRLNPEEYHRLRRDAHLLRNLFVSFEKERIVKPIVNPLLRRAVVARILAKQGSAFARAPSFQLYRFRDGAWADIILGAVMGAAKRVEAQRRYERLVNGPTLDVSGRAEPTGAPHVDVAETAAAHPAASDRARVAQHVARAGAVRADTDAIADVANELGTGIALEPWETDASVHALAAVGGGGLSGSHVPNRMTRGATIGGASEAAQPATRSAFGPYASGAARDLASDSPHRQQHDQGHDTGDLAAADASTGAPSATRPTEPLAVRLRRQRAAQPTEADIEIVQSAAAETAVAATPPSNVYDLRERRRMPKRETTETAIGAESAPETHKPFSEMSSVQPPPVAEPAERTVTFRVTERTADVTVPVSEASLPLVFGRSAQTDAAIAQDDAIAVLSQTYGEPQNEPAIAAIQPPPVPLLKASDELKTNAKDAEFIDAAPTRSDDAQLLGAEADEEVIALIAPIEADDEATFDPVLSRFAPRRTTE